MNFELARQIVIEWDDEGAVDVLTADSVGAFFENYGDQEDWIVEAAAEAIGIDNLTYQFDGQHAYICFGDRAVKVPAEPDPKLHEMLMKTLNETLSPEFECRRVFDRHPGSYHLYMPLDRASWSVLEQEFSKRRLDKIYIPLDFDNTAGRHRKPVHTSPVIHRLHGEPGPVIQPDLNFADKVERFQQTSRTADHATAPLLAGPTASPVSSGDLQSRVAVVPVLTAKGFKPICQVVVGDELVILHVDKLTIGTRKVARVELHQGQTAWEIGLRMPDGNVQTTLVHGNLTVWMEVGWGPPDYLLPDSKVRLHDGDWAIVERAEEKRQVVDVYDLYPEEDWAKLDGWAYSYGQMGIWVYSNQRG